MEGLRAWCMAAVLASALPARAEIERVSNIRVRNAQRSWWIENAMLGAARSLARPECNGILAAFRDGEGRSLQENLNTLGVDASSYVHHYIFFHDGDSLTRCSDNRIQALTLPFSRVIYVCPRFGDWQHHDMKLAEAVIIHEVLHTLGLGENPPSSGEITWRVRERCG